MKLSKFSIENSSALDVVIDLIEDLTYIKNDLSRKGYVCDADFGINKLIVSFQSLYSAINAFAENISDLKNYNECIKIFCKILYLGNEVNNIKKFIQEQGLVFYNTEVSDKLRQNEPAIFFELSNIYVDVVLRGLNGSMDLAFDFMLKVIIKFCKKYNIDSSEYKEQIESNYPDIAKLIEMIKNSIGVESDEAMLASIIDFENQGNIESLTPPPSDVAAVITLLSQSNVPEISINNGVCYGDSSLAIKSFTYMLGNISAAAIAAQAYTPSSYTYLDSVSFKKQTDYTALANNVLEYFINSPHNTSLLEIHDNEYDINTVGHAVCLGKIEGRSEVEYIYRDVNIGVFKIIDINAFANWLGMQLAYHQATSINVKTSPQQYFIDALEHLGTKTTISNFLKHLIGVRQNFISAANVDALNPNLITSEKDKLYYGLSVSDCVAEEIVSFDCLPLLSKAKNLIESIKNESNELTLIKRAIYFYMGYTFWRQNNLNMAVKCFADYNNVCNSESHINIEANGNIDGNILCEVINQIEVSVVEYVIQEFNVLKHELIKSAGKYPRPYLMSDVVKGSMLFSKAAREMYLESELEGARERLFPYANAPLRLYL